MIYKRKPWSQLVIILLLIFTNSLIHLSAQESTLKFKSYSSKNGLNQSSVVTIFQDDEGFLWLGTYFGLNRFDGNNFKAYNFKLKDDKIVSDMVVRSICQDTTGIFFVGTKKGVFRFFSHTGQFIPLQHNPEDPNSLANNTVFKILKDRDGDIWIGTRGGGLDKLEKIEGNYKNELDVKYRFIHHKANKNQNSISSNIVTDMVEGPDGTIWIATQRGLNKFDKKTNRFTAYVHDPENLNTIANNDVSSVCFDKDGNIWVGTWGHGLSLFNIKNETFTNFRNNPDDAQSLGQNVIMSVYCDKKGTIWVGTWGGGLDKVLYTQSQDKGKPSVRFQHHRHNKFDVSSLSGNSIYSIFEDSFGFMWIGTDYAGVNKVEKLQNKFQHIYAEQKSSNHLSNNTIYSLLLDNNKIWIGTQGGVDLLDLQSNNYTHFQYNPSDPNSLSHNTVISILKTSNGQLWLGTNNGLNKYLPKKGGFKKYYNTLFETGMLHCLTLYEDKEKNIWIGTYGLGLLKFNPKKEQFKVYAFNPNNPKGISDNIIWKVVEDNKGQMWIGTENGGLCLFDKEKEEFKTFKNIPEDSTSLVDNHINTIYIDKSGTLWIATVSGLCKLKYDKNGKPSFIRYAESASLASSNILGIVEDNYNNFWLATQKGLYQFNPDKNTYKPFTLKDGLQDSEFSIDAIINDTATGKIYAGGINGLNFFNPTEISENKIPPIVKIVDFKLFTKSVNVGEEINGRVILSKDITSIDHLELTYKEYVFSLEFAALHFQSPENNQFAYKLEGFDKEWNYIGSLRSASYTNLEPGEYIFKVKASNSDGVWNPEPAVLKISIKPPWWDTLWFKILVAFIFITTIISIYRIRVRILNKNKAQLEKLVGLRTLELSEANTLLEERQEEITQQNNELNKVNELLLEKQEEISLQNEELNNHRINLEKTVDERTSELKIAKEKAEESDKLKSSFLANMSHEVRTPMNAILGFSSLLNKDSLTKEKRAFYQKMIKSNGDTLLTLIDDILDISLIEANQLVLYKAEFCLDDLLVEINSYYRLSNEKGLNIELVTGKNKSILFNDPIRLRQVITNLVGNAVKYTEKGFVRFGYLPKENFVEIFIEDSGPGISHEDQKRVFNYFQKLENKDTRLYRGAGIGLSISKRIVELMGSEIHIESELGKGSRFYFRLPQIENSKKVQETISKPFTETNLQNVNVVVAEDEPYNFMLVESILSNTGANIIWAKNGQEAIEHVKQNISQNKNCLVLMDIKMPVMNGIDANRIIKSLSSKIPVIALTAYAKPTDKIRIMNEQFDYYISKPLNPIHLLETVSLYAGKL